MVSRAGSALSASSLLLPTAIVRGMVSLHGPTVVVPFHRDGARLHPRPRRRHVHHVEEEIPPPPEPLFSIRFVERLLEWWSDKTQILCLTGAGISTESGIPDYRGHNGSYHKGHKPMVHDQFMNSEYQRQRYWGRGMVGWKSLDERRPNAGHIALAQLEHMGKIGVPFDDRPEFHDDDTEDTRDSSHGRRLALVTQNVDTLHRKAGSKHLIELHGRGDRLKCMTCGAFSDRKHFHTKIEALNHEWLQRVLEKVNAADMRPDGDAAVAEETYESIQVPPCPNCGTGFLKPDVVFFGDTVPSSRVEQCRAAVERSDGLLVVGSSLAVHSAYRHVRAASQLGIPIAILNVGRTRAEAEGLDVLKLEAPAGTTLAAVAAQFATVANPVVATAEAGGHI